LKSQLFRFHRWLSLCFAAFWLLQGVSGAYLVFARSIDDVNLGASGQPTDPVAVGRVIDAIQRAGGTVDQFFVSGGTAGQIDIVTQKPGGERELVRIDGASGRVLRVSSASASIPHNTLARSIFLLHRQLLCGEVGRWLMAISGLLLISNVLIGLRLAWPGRGRWRAALLPGIGKKSVVNMFSWHRATGLWLTPTLLVTATTGVLLEFTTALERVVGAETALPAECAEIAPTQPAISIVAAQQSAYRAFPGSSIAVVTFPTPLTSCYKIQMRQPSEIRRVFGTSFVYVNARTGTVVEAYDATRAPIPQKMLAGIYAVHSGEWGGIGTRIVSVLAGLGLSIAIFWGVRLWNVRRQLRKQRRSPAA
jgi:uncharacterized iron-regulated membrane protein